MLISVLSYNVANLNIPVILLITGFVIPQIKSICISLIYILTILQSKNINWTWYLEYQYLEYQVTIIYTENLLILLMKTIKQRGKK